MKAEPFSSLPLFDIPEPEGKLEELEELPELPVGGAAAPADGVVHPHAVVPAVKVEGDDEL